MHCEAEFLNPEVVAPILDDLAALASVSGSFVVEAHDNRASNNQYA